MPKNSIHGTALCVLGAIVGCSPTDDTNGATSASGGALATTGGTPASSGGSSGGVTPTGGTSSGGSKGGSSPTTGGTTTGGVATGGSAGAGASTGGTAGMAGGAPSTGGVGTTGGAAGAGANGMAGAAGSSAGSSTGGAAGAGGAGNAGTNGGGGAAPKAGSWKIMPLGDSITETTCQTQLLWDVLRDNGHTNFDLVGTKQNQQACNVTNPDRDCEGHGGYRVSDLLAGGSHQNELDQWVTANPPDIVLMHFGTNDMWNSSAVTPQATLSAFSFVLTRLRAGNPNVIVFVAKIVPLNPSDCAACPSNATGLNDAIPAWASGESSPQSPVYVVDQWTGFVSASDTGDGVHPNVQGSQKMADKWYAALVERGIF